MKSRKQLFFILISFIAALGGFLFGFDTAVVSGTLIFVKEQFYMSTVSEGWFVSSALVGSVTGVALAGIASDRFGRKNLTIMGAGLSLLCHAVIGMLFFTGRTDGFLFPFFILLYTATFAASYGPVFWTVISEIYPNQIRGVAMSMTAFANWIATALVAQLVPWMLETLKPSGTFRIFAACSVPALVFALCVLPETRGKSLEEIEKIWTE